MEIVVKIPDDMIKSLEQGNFGAKYNIYDLVGYLMNGTPLPKGHGRLIILSEDKLKENQINLDWSYQKCFSEVGLSNATVAIIKADTESEEI